MNWTKGMRTRLDVTVRNEPSEGLLSACGGLRARWFDVYGRYKIKIVPRLRTVQSCKPSTAAHPTEGMEAHFNWPTETNAEVCNRIDWSARPLSGRSSH